MARCIICDGEEETLIWFSKYRGCLIIDSFFLIIKSVSIEPIVWPVRVFIDHCPLVHGVEVLLSCSALFLRSAVYNEFLISKRYGGDKIQEEEQIKSLAPPYSPKRWVYIMCTLTPQVAQISRKGLNMHLMEF